MKPVIDIKRSADRFLTKTGWLESRHSFSFGHHYDPDNTNFDLLVVSNDDWVQPGTGFMTHPHRDMEIVTWVLEGQLEHKDSTGNKGIIVPGDAQRMSAGRGILHSEINYSAVEPVHFVQMWVLPDTENLDPGYEEIQIGHVVEKGGLFPIASGKGYEGAIRIRQKDATLWGARLKAGQSIVLPDARAMHVYVANGPVELEDAGRLETGDAARVLSGGARRVTAAPGAEKAELLIWQFSR